MLVLRAPAVAVVLLVPAVAVVLLVLLAAAAGACWCCRRMVAAVGRPAAAVGRARMRGARGWAG